MAETAMPQVMMPTNSSRSFSDDFTKWTLKFEDLLELIGHDLRGDKYDGIDTNTGLEKWKTGTPLLNESGINYILGKLRTITNKNTYMSSVSENQAFRIAESTCHAIEMTLFLKNKEFDLAPQNWATIMDTVRDTIELALSRPIEGEERRTIREGEAVSRIISEGVETKKPGVGIGPFRLWG